MTLTLREFGKTGLKIPPLVFGATSLGNLFRVVEDSEKSAIVESWLKTGLKPVVIDSAGKYGAGLSLEIIGRELERLNASPEDVLVSNKLAWRRIPLKGSEPSFEPGAWFGLQHDAVQDISYDGILRCWQEGNELLRGHPAQIVSVHDPDEYLAAASDAADRQARIKDLVDAYRALRELKDVGKVQAVGVGAKDWRAIQELSQHCDFDWVMLANSYTIMRHPPELSEFMYSLSHKGIAIINSALFHGGFLLGGEFFDYRKVAPNYPHDAERIHWRERFQAACDRHGVSPFQVGVAFGLAHPAVTAVALSSGRAERISSHVLAVQQTVPPALWNDLREQGLIDASCDFLQ